jgi:hypothetical protein
MQPVSTFFKEENDFMYRRGKKASSEAVKRMPSANKFTISEIAKYVDVSEEFVIEIQQKQSPSQ